MATTTATITVNSTDLLTDELSLATTATLYNNPGYTTGLQRLKVQATAVHSTATVLYTADDFAAIAYLYVKNTATTAGHKIYIYDDSSTGDPIQFQLDAGDWGFIPMHGDKTYKAYSPGGNDPTVEWMVMGKDQ